MLRLVPVAELTGCDVILTRTRLLLAGRVKLLPVMVTLVPGKPIWGTNSVIVGAPKDRVTAKMTLLVAVPKVLLALIGPVVAPLGTVTTS